MKQAVILLGHGSIREQANVEVRNMWKMLAEQLPDCRLAALCRSGGTHAGAGNWTVGGAGV